MQIDKQNKLLILTDLIKGELPRKYSQLTKKIFECGFLPLIYTKIVNGNPILKMEIFDKNYPENEFNFLKSYFENRKVSIINMPNLEMIDLIKNPR